MSRHLTYVAILGVTLAASARAANCSWQAASGDWSIASNWGGTLPTSSVAAYVVNGGTATVTQNDAYSILLIGSSAGGGCIQMTTGSLSGTVQSVGASGKGIFNQSGGTNSVADDMYVGGSPAGGIGSYTLSGSGLLLVSNTLTLGDSPSSSGSFSLSQDGRLSAKVEVIGGSGTGEFTQSGGTNNCTSFGIDSAGSNAGTYNLNGGLLAFSNPFLFGYNAAFNFNGGTLQASGSFSAALPMTLGTSGGGATIDTAGHAVTLSASLSGAGGLTKAGSGTLSLTGTNTYTGPTMIEQGLLIVNGPFASPLTVESGGSLGGTGSLTSVTVNSGGQLAPGGPLDVLQLSGSLSLLPGAALDYELGAPATSDLILMPSGALTLTGQQFGDFTITPLSGFAPGDYMLIDAGSISGGLGANVGGTIDGLPATMAVHGNDVVLHVVPEPSTLALLAAGSIGWLGFHRLKRRMSLIRRIQSES